MINQYQIDLPVFAGPLDLLLHLIERQQLDITEISLVQVTEQYLAQIERLKENKIEQLIDFIAIAARLVLVKSRALLPQTPIIIEGEESEEDPAEALVRQLKLYKRFKQAAEFLKRREEAGRRTYLRVAPPPRLESRLDLTGIDVQILLDAMLNALERAETLDDSVQIVQPRRITIEGQIGKLRRWAQRGESIRFDELLTRNSNRLEVSVTLLALLEMIKQREINVFQSELFGPIEIRPIIEQVAQARYPDG